MSRPLYLADEHICISLQGIRSLERVYYSATPYNPGAVHRLRIRYKTHQVEATYPTYEAMQAMYARLVAALTVPAPKKGASSPVASPWEHTANPGEVPCHSRLVGGVLCRWWGSEEPEGVQSIDAAADDAPGTTETPRQQGMVGD